MANVSNEQSTETQQHQKQPPAHRLFGVPMIGSARMGDSIDSPSYMYLFYANGEVIRRDHLVEELRELGYTISDDVA